MILSDAPVEFREAIDYFGAKVNLPTKVYSDLWGEANTVGFTVAGATKTSLLEDFRNSIDRIQKAGGTLADFRSDFDSIVQKHGWSYKGKRGWRSRVIFETNLRTASMAGRWQQIERVKKQRPYLRYVSVNDDRTRRQHKAWHGLVYPVDHAFWKTHYPLNGWGCRCTVQSLSERDVKRLGYNVSSLVPPDGIVSHGIKTSSGEVRVEVPKGIDPGWDYNVGRNRLTSITPPPTPGTPKSGAGLPSSSPLPSPRTFTASKLMPEGKSEEEYARAFLKEFDGDLGKAKLFTDKAGEVIPVSEELFKTVDGKWKVTKFGREPYIRLLAENIKDPDEIWFDWAQTPSGEWRLRRRYISRFEIKGTQQSGYAVFEIMRDGWREVTNFTPKHGKSEKAQNEYLEKQRRGTLVYKKE